MRLEDKQQLFKHKDRPQGLTALARAAATSAVRERMLRPGGRPTQELHRPAAAKVLRIRPASALWAGASGVETRARVQGSSLHCYSATQDGE